MGPSDHTSHLSVSQQATTAVQHSELCPHLLIWRVAVTASHVCDGLLRGVVEVVGRDDVEARFLDDLLAHRDVGALEAHDERDGEVDLRKDAMGGDG
jgi:hypothetical protein